MLTDEDIEVLLDLVEKRITKSAKTHRDEQWQYYTSLRVRLRRMLVAA